MGRVIVGRVIVGRVIVGRVNGYHILHLIYTRIPHTDQSCDLNLPQCKYFHVSIFACSVAVFFKTLFKGTNFAVRRVREG